MTVTVRAQSMLADLPPYLADEERVAKLYQVVANEMDYAWELLTTLRVGLTPHTAHDQLSGLSMLEAELDLPVAPAGETEEHRREKVLAYLRARRAGTGAAWIALMQLAFGNSPWTYREGPDDFTVVIMFPYAEDSFTAGRVLSFARAITPAHIDIIPEYDQGFLIGISQIGVEAL